MAQEFVNTGTQLGNREDIRDFIADVNYKKTPLLKVCGKTDATAITHEWMEDTLRAGATNAKAEGFTPTFAASDNQIRIRRSNYCQILAQPISASRTQNIVNKVGLGRKSEYDHQLEKATIALSLDINYNLWNSTSTARDADAGTAGKMSGYFDVDDISTTALTTAVVISDDIYNRAIQEMVDRGVDVDLTFCNGFNKRQISGWMTANRRYSDGKKITDVVNEYESDWGMQTIMYDKDVPQSAIAITQRDQLKVAMLDPFKHTRLGVTGDAERGFVLSELTFEYGARKAIGSITNLLYA